jgi:hypothetical protein
VHRCADINMMSIQVRAGPDALPGAVAVEDEQGRMLSLATLAAEVIQDVTHSDLQAGLCPEAAAGNGLHALRPRSMCVAPSSSHVLI